MRPLVRFQRSTVPQLHRIRFGPQTRLKRSSTMSSRHKQENPEKPHPKFGHLPLSTSGPLNCALTGSALLNTPFFNKGTAFPKNERVEFKLTGLLPPNIQTLDEQAGRAYQQYSGMGDDLAKNTFMTSMKDQNIVLFYRVSSNLSRFYSPRNQVEGNFNEKNILSLSPFSYFCILLYDICYSSTFWML